jgi:hypothetical protein
MPIAPACCRYDSDRKEKADYRRGEETRREQKEEEEEETEEALEGDYMD